jgi:hypothetical protein
LVHSSCDAVTICPIDRCALGYERQLSFCKTSLRALRRPRSSGVQEFRSSGVQEFRSSGVQEFRSSGVQEFRSSGVQGRSTYKIASTKAPWTKES